MRKALIAGVLLVVLVAANRPAIAAPRAATLVPAGSSIVSLFLGLFTEHPAPPAPKSLRTARGAGMCIGNFPTPRFGNCP